MTAPFSREEIRGAAAALEGVAVRMRPIFMTAATTFVGLLPMAVFGDENEGISYVGLSIAVAGGLLVSTVSTAVAVPLCYTFADDVVRLLRRLAARVAGRLATMQEHKQLSASSLVDAAGHALDHGWAIHEVVTW